MTTIYRCLFETRYRRPAKIDITTIVIDLPAAKQGGSKDPAA